jgi:hypothetical protein
MGWSASHIDYTLDVHRHISTCALYRTGHQRIDLVNDRDSQRQKLHATVIFLVRCFEDPESEHVSTNQIGEPGHNGKKLESR